MAAKGLFLQQLCSTLRVENETSEKSAYTMDVKLVYAHSFSIFLCWYFLVENDKGFKGFFFSLYTNLSEWGVCFLMWMAVMKGRFEVYFTPNALLL